MKYAIIIPDGAADDPLTDLGGKTPFEAANIPNMDAVAIKGWQGTAATIPAKFAKESGSDIGIMSLLGYDPVKYHTGRAPLEAAAQKIPLSPTDWVFRCNLVTAVDGIMKDHSAGGISNAEARRLIADLAATLQLPGWEFYPGVGFRNLLVYRGVAPFDVTTKPPHEFPEEPIAKYLPRGTGNEVLRSIMDASAHLFADHEINEVRRQTGHNPATQVWLWGQGKAPNLPKFVDEYRIERGCMITGVDLPRGIAYLIGWDVPDVAGTGDLHENTDYAAQGRETVAMLDKYDLVISHVESPDEASHQGDHKTKVAAIEAIDQHIVGPVLAKLRTFDQWRLLIVPDHPTLISTRKHGSGPVPFAMCGTGIDGVKEQPYNERNAAAGGMSISHGHELMEFFLRGGKS
jgi:2,3-bisphosphoglycerate-independent phosphoglycerate mutase